MELDQVVLGLLAVLDLVGHRSGAPVVVADQGSPASRPPACRRRSSPGPRRSPRDRAAGSGHMWVQSRTSDGRLYREAPEIRAPGRGRDTIQGPRTGHGPGDAEPARSRRGAERAAGERSAGPPREPRVGEPGEVDLVERRDDDVGVGSRQRGLVVGGRGRGRRTRRPWRPGCRRRHPRSRRRRAGRRRARWTRRGRCPGAGLPWSKWRPEVSASNAASRVRPGSIHA